MMNVGFVTASGKDIKVSEEALQKARDLFEELENSDDLPVQRASTPNTSHISNVDSTPVTPVAFSTAGATMRQCYKRISPAFRSPVVKNPRLENVGNVNNSTDFISPVKRPSLPEATPRASVTPKKSAICSERTDITPIKLLTPYCKSWRLCVKVTSVDRIRQFRDQHVFSFLAVDDSGVEIRVSAFGGIAQEVAAIIHPEQMYYITRASVKLTNRRYSRTQHDMEVVLRPDSEVTVCMDRPLISSPKVNFAFVHLQNLKNFIDNEIDVLGIVVDVGDLRQISLKSGQMLDKRDIQIVDSSGYCVTVSLWEQKAKTFTDQEYEHVLAIKGLFVRCFQGAITLATVSSSRLLLNPPFTEADALRAWYSENKKITYKQATTNQVLSFREHRWIGQLKPSKSARVFNVSAMISSISTENAVYKGCPLCKKKLLLEKDTDLYICPKCGISDEYKYYYSLNMELVDFTGSLRVSTFDDCGQKLFGEEADEVAKFLKFDKERYERCFRAALFKSFMFRIMAREKESMSATKSTLGVSYVWLVIDLAPMPFDSYSTFLQRSIATLNSSS